MEFSHSFLLFLLYAPIYTQRRGFGRRLAAATSHFETIAYLRPSEKRVWIKDWTPTQKVDRREVPCHKLADAVSVERRSATKIVTQQAPEVVGNSVRAEGNVTPPVTVSPSVWDDSFGVQNSLIAATGPEHLAKGRKKQAIKQPTAHRTAHPQDTPIGDELQLLIGAWPNLPATIRQALIALVRRC
jgi:hypothetical protein